MLKVFPRPCGEELQDAGQCSQSRRDFLWNGGAVAIGAAVLSMPNAALGVEVVRKRVAVFPPKRIASISRIREGDPIEFQFPHEHPNCASFVVKLGVPAGGGLGPGRDVVAFNALCTHMGGLLTGTYDAKYRVAGPCPLHLTTFDLTRHGIVVAGHATESLPQVILAIEGDDIVATGMTGLIYGFSSNFAQPKKVG